MPVLVLAFALSLLWSASVDAVNIGDIIVRFCDEEGTLEKKVSYEMDPEEEREVCVKVYNTSNETAYVELGFTDGTVTKDNSQYKACLSSQDVDNFAKFATIDESFYEIPARSSVTTKFSLVYPEGFAGMSYGCLVTMLGTAETESADGGMLSVQLRQGHFVDVYVDGEIFLDVHFDEVNAAYMNLSKNPLVHVDQKKIFGDYVSTVKLVNSGNVAQDVEVRRITKWLFGYEVIENLWEITLVPWESDSFSHMVSVPWYKMMMKVKYEAIATPKFDFESDSITDEMKTSSVIMESTSFFVFPLWLLCVLAFVAVVLLIVTVYKHKKRKINASPKKKPAAKKSSIKKPTKKSKKTQSKAKKK